LAAYAQALTQGAVIDRAVRTADGLSLHARDYEPLAPVTGLPVVCLHGLTRNANDFEIVAPRIAALGRRVIALSMRGRGRSDRDPDPAHYAPPVYAQDVIAAMAQLDMPRAVFIGTSMGGLISMLIAAMAPDKIAACVLNDIGPELDPAGLRRIGAYVGQQGAVTGWSAAADVARKHNEIAFPGRDQAFWEAFARRTFRERPDGALEPDYDPMIALAFQPQPGDAPAPDMTPLFAALAKASILVVRGGTSDLLSPQGVARMQSLAPGAAVAVVDGVGHAPMLDEPQAWDAILEFLARTP
jgi:pimeloyl-ACP methyl ester carboxylesterase